MASFTATLQEYEGSVRSERELGKVDLPNDNFDTGTQTGPGQYPLADKTYAQLLDRLAQNHFDRVSPQLQRDVLGYYGNLEAPFATKKDRKGWTRTLQQVDQLKAFMPGNQGL
jgi:hypothetical protein